MLACRAHAARFLAYKHEGSFYAMVDRHVFGLVVVGQGRPYPRVATSAGPRSVAGKAPQCSFRNCPQLIPIVCCGVATWDNVCHALVQAMAQVRQSTRDTPLLL